MELQHWTFAGFRVWVLVLVGYQGLGLRFVGYQGLDFKACRVSGV